MLIITAIAQSPQTLNYQGYLTDSSGDPVADGNQAISFRIYNVATAGSAL
ncbi:hypothetical protein OAQ99_03855 [Candidatus Kapabacteria bacterium]|nr:hypothetical protein [Candidatus Kapabacteria bacterium]